MRVRLLLIGALATFLSVAIGFAQAPQTVNAPARGSASVRVPAWRQLRTAVESLLGWQVGVSLGSFRQDTFVDAVRKAEALDLAIVEGDSTQKVSVQIPKSLDYKLAPGEREAVRELMIALNIRMPLYVTSEVIRRPSSMSSKGAAVESARMPISASGRSSVSPLSRALHSSTTS